MSDFKADNFGHTVKESAKTIGDKLAHDHKAQAVIGGVLLFKDKVEKVVPAEVAGATIGGITVGSLVGWGAVGVAGGLAIPGATAVGVPVAATVVGGALAGAGATTAFKAVKKVVKPKKNKGVAEEYWRSQGGRL